VLQSFDLFTVEQPASWKQVDDAVHFSGSVC
jgi:hypothetical protein